MKTKHGVPRIGWITMALLSSVLTAQAFYNPQTGRWLSRDPVDERGGNNLYALVSNRSLDSADAVGLSEAAWGWTDGGQGEQKTPTPDTPEGNTYLKFWGPVAKAVTASDGSASWELTTGGHGGVYFYWTTLKVKAHEQEHAARWTRSWKALKDQALSLEGVYCTKAVPECLAGVIERTMKDVYYKQGDWLQKQWDCEDYPPGPAKDKACRERDRLDAEALKLAWRLERELDACYALGSAPRN